MPDQYNQPIIPLTTPFQNIALAFSGGGFRASSFSLGVMAYLNSITAKDSDGKERPLLEHVTYISSASGGTITNAAYALHKAHGKDFNAYYKHLYDAMNGESLLSAALDNLNNKNVWKNISKTRNIINSFAISYNSPELFNNATLGELCDPQYKTHLEEVCFNSTEFFSGSPFRQQVKMQQWHDAATNHLHYGNHVVNIKGDVIKQLKIADLLAASSCFPSGFEPIEMPKDFIYNGLKPEDLKSAIHITPVTNSSKEKEFIEAGCLGLMDGGITDNQGLESLMEADVRRRQLNSDSNFRPFDLIIVNDVGSFYMSPYTVPAANDKHIDSLSVRNFVILLNIIMVVCVFLFFRAFNLEHIWRSMLAIIIAVLCAIALLPIFIIHRNLTSRRNRSAINLENTFSQAVAEKLVFFMRRSPVGLLKQALKTRFNSMMILTGDVFMSRIRQILYRSFYNNPLWNNRRKGNHIYDLSFSNDINRIANDIDAPTPSPQLQIVAETAATMGTTLWFDEQSPTSPHSMACIIATGSFTTCYNLIDYINNLRRPEVWNGFDAAAQDMVNTIEKQLQADWANFVHDPFFQYNKIGTKILGVKFSPIDYKTIPRPA